MGVKSTNAAKGDLHIGEMDDVNLAAEVDQSINHKKKTVN